MFTFRFIIEDSDGKHRRGQIKASSEQRAREQIEAGNYTIISLEPVIQGKLSFRAAREKFRGLKFAPPDQTEYLPTLGERVYDALTNQDFLKKLAQGVGLTGTLVFILFASFNAGERRDTIPPPPKKKVVVSGRLLGPDEDALLVVNLPDVPYRESFAAESVLNGSSEYEVTVEFLSRREIRSAVVALEKDGHTQKSSEPFDLAGEPLRGSAPDL